MARQWVEVDHRIVVHKAQPRRDYAGRRAKGMSQGNTIAGTVYDADMRGVWGAGGAAKTDFNRLVGVEVGAPFSRTRFAHHPIEWDILELGGSHRRVTVGKGGFHRHRNPINV